MPSCPGCHKLVWQDVVHCPSCGTKLYDELEDASPHVEAPRHDDPPPPPPPPPAPTVQGYPPRTSPYAIASLILSLLWMAGLGSLLAIIFGSLAKTDINHYPERYDGSGIATAGTVLGWLGLIVAFFFWWLIIFLVTCPSNQTCTVF